jgi:hypothetical protein
MRELTIEQIHTVSGAGLIGLGLGAVTSSICGVIGCVIGALTWLPIPHTMLFSSIGYVIGGALGSVGGFIIL